MTTLLEGSPFHPHLESPAAGAAVDGAGVASNWLSVDPELAWQLDYRAIARSVTVVSTAGVSDASWIRGRMEEASECVDDFRGLSRTDETESDLRTNVVDVLGRSRFGDGVVLVTRVRDERSDLGDAGLRSLHAVLAWTKAYDHDRDGLVDSINRFEREAGSRRPDELLPRFGGFAIRPVVAFDAPPDLANVRRLARWLEELSHFDPTRTMRSVEVWAWPAHGLAFRIPERLLLSRPSRRRCPSCGSPYVVEILMGMPSSEGQAASDRGELILGGCLVDDDDPRWACRACDARW